RLENLGFQDDLALQVALRLAQGGLDRLLVSAGSAYYQQPGLRVDHHLAALLGTDHHGDHFADFRPEIHVAAGQKLAGIDRRRGAAGGRAANADAGVVAGGDLAGADPGIGGAQALHVEVVEVVGTGDRLVRLDLIAIAGTDRKSTRLNSSHVKISDAVFCLKKKTGRRS